MIRLIEEYGGTDEGQQGMLILANIYYQQKKYDDAEIYFQEFVDSYSGSDILLSSGYAGLAACQEINDNYMAAAELYETAAKTAPDYIESDNFMYLSGICYLKADDDETARQIFKKIIDTSKTNQRVKDAEAQLVMLGEKIPRQ